MVDSSRVRNLVDIPQKEGPVVYWMQRDMRAHHNWALIYAQEKAQALKVPLIVVFALDDRSSFTRTPHFSFMMQGLYEVRDTLAPLAIPLCILKGDPKVSILAFLQEVKAGMLVCDFTPLRYARTWKDAVALYCDVRFDEVDAHNIVPCWVASHKEEFAAYTFRPKIRAHYRAYSGPVPRTKKHPYVHTKSLPSGGVIPSASSVFDRVTPGAKAGDRALSSFLTHRLSAYDAKRNDPTEDGQSGLSPYIHFGHLSAQQIAHKVETCNATSADKKAFLEELVVRKELSDNFCFYQPAYDRYEGLRSWAKDTLEAHLHDVREFVYSEEEFEHALTHDPLWNAAQTQMVQTGTMHGYMRMYWAKKILEWTQNPHDAIAIAITLNDTYSLDGRDPNGYAGILWSIGGLHDRAWFERPIFGKIRYMNYNGCARKFDVKRYIEMFSRKVS